MTAVDVTSGDSGGVDPLLDHLVYAVPDLDAAVDWFEVRTGLRPAAGGRHLGLGTRNFLVRLGPASYLEIIGMDVEHPPAPGATVPFGVDRIGAPRLLTWAVHPVELDAAVSQLAAAGADLGAPRAMSRRTPSGALLEWRLATVLPLPSDGVVPFLIDWGSSTHPAADPSLPTAPLISFAGTHPDPAAVTAVLSSAGMTLALEAGPVGLTAVLDTPRGRLTLR